MRKSPFPLILLPDGKTASLERNRDFCYNIITKNGIFPQRDGGG